MLKKKKYVIHTFCLRANRLMTQIGFVGFEWSFWVSCARELRVRSLKIIIRIARYNIIMMRMITIQSQAAAISKVDVFSVFCLYLCVMCKRRCPHSHQRLDQTARGLTFWWCQITLKAGVRVR